MPIFFYALARGLKPPIDCWKLWTVSLWPSLRIVASPMPKIFISYRRADTSKFVTPHIYKNLVDRYGEESVVYDVDSIPKASDFVDFINQELSESDLFLAVIGEKWLEVQENGVRRIDDPEDHVRMEIATALQREQLKVLPVLVDTQIPKADQLPDVLKQLTNQNASVVRSGRDFLRDLEDLVQAVHKLLPTTTDTNSIGMKLTLIEPGPVLMGTLEGNKWRATIEEPFRLGVYPVTQAEYQKVMGENPSEFQGDDCRPVESVSWFDSIEFCNQLSQQEDVDQYYDVVDNLVPVDTASEKKQRWWERFGRQQKPVKQVKVTQVKLLGGGGYRLPTEAEWEYACRAGTTREYCFGDYESELGKYAWYAETSSKKTHPVGEVKANTWGLYDMHGNVWEWCWDRYGEYPTEPQTNSTGPPHGSCRVIRGGSWIVDAGFCRSACRGWDGPGNRRNDLGFRVARTAL